MQWLVTTLAARSLVRGRRSGAPARRRYRAVVVEPGDVFGRVGLALDLETIRAAGSRALEVFQPELVDYKTSKGTVQFPHDRDLPLDLVTRMVEFCATAMSAKLVPPALA